MTTSVYLCDASDVPLNNSALVIFKDEEFALFHTETGYYAVTNRCPHQEASLLGCPVLKDSAVCTLHGWRIPLRPAAEGRVHRDGLTRLEVTEQNGRLYAAA